MFAQTEDRNSLPAQSERPAVPFVENLCARTVKLLPCYLPPRWTERPVSLYYKQVILLNKDKLLMIAVCVFIASQEISATSKQHSCDMQSNAVAAALKVELLYQLWLSIARRRKWSKYFCKKVLTQSRTYGKIMPR